MVISLVKWSAKKLWNGMPNLDLFFYPHKISVQTSVQNKNDLTFKKDFWPAKISTFLLNKIYETYHMFDCKHKKYQTFNFSPVLFEFFGHVKEKLIKQKYKLMFNVTWPRFKKWVFFMKVIVHFTWFYPMYKYCSY